MKYFRLSIVIRITDGHANFVQTEKMIKRIVRIEFLLIDAARLASTGPLDAVRARLLQVDDALQNAATKAWV
jgi:hypothetical protein